MAPASYPQQENPITVIGPQFCAPNPVELTVGNFLTVTDHNGNIMFTVKGDMFSFRDKHVLLDAAGNPIVSISQKIFSTHGRWEVCKGDSSSDQDLLFTVKKSAIFQLESHLDVFLVSNTKEDVSDFKITGSWSKRSCVVYLGDSTDIVAQMHNEDSVDSEGLGEDTFMVTVNPDVDHAFIVALLVILNENDAIKKGMPSGG